MDGRNGIILRQGCPPRQSRALRSFGASALGKLDPLEQQEFKTNGVKLDDLAPYPQRGQGETASLGG